MTPPVYFSVADRQFEAFFAKDEFDRSLIHNALFQRRILIPDVFFFISEGLEQHVNRQDGMSFLEKLIAEGIAIPCFRRTGTCSFGEGLRIIQGAGDPAKGIQGVRQELAKSTAARLDVAAELGNRFQPAYWPDDISVGEAYYRVLKTHLSAQVAPTDPRNSLLTQERLNDLWERTAEWRKECIDKAYEMTQKKGDPSDVDPGVQRGDILNTIGQTLGFPKDYEVHDVKVLLDCPLEPVQRSDLRHFLRWVSELYRYNQAIQFGTLPNFPCYDADAGLIAARVMPRGPEIVDTSSVPAIQHTVKLPSIDVLKRISPDALVGIRNDNCPAYLSAVERWQRDPSSTNEACLRHTLDRYAAAICIRAQRQELQPPVSCNVLLERIWSLGKEVLALLADTAATMWQPLSTFLALGKAGLAFYQWRADTELATIGTNAPKEVNLPPGETADSTEK